MEIVFLYIFGMTFHLIKKYEVSVNWRTYLSKDIYCEMNNIKCLKWLHMIYLLQYEFVTSPFDSKWIISLTDEK